MSKTNLIDEMFTEEARLETFKNWPFASNTKCSATRMAEAGFFHCPSKTEPDLVQCYVCYKELDGWEANDDPWDEHFSHSKICVFAQKRKPQKLLTLEEVFEVETERKVMKIKKYAASRIASFKERTEKWEDPLQDIFNEVDTKK